jgi:hypothetical protein
MFKFFKKNFAHISKKFITFAAETFMSYVNNNQKFYERLAP